jgi:hypothetical protein
MMSPKEHKVLLQKQLKIAMKALKDIRDNGVSWTVAEAAIDEIERIKIRPRRSTRLNINNQ